MERRVLTFSIPAEYTISREIVFGRVSNDNEYCF